MQVAQIIVEAWQTKNPDLLSGILAESFAWYEDPLTRPVTDKVKLLKMWQGDIAEQENISVSFEAISDQTVTWQAVYTSGGVKYELSGVWTFQLDPNGKLVEFRQWWMKQ